MLPVRLLSRRGAVSLLCASLAFLAGCLPNLEGAQCETDQNCPSSQFCNAGVCKEGQRPARAATASATAALGVTTASVGQALTLTLTITNTGTVTLEGVTPAAPTTAGAAAAVVDSGPMPASARLIPGASASFRYTVHATAPGTFTFTAGAQGNAFDTNEAVAASATTTAVTAQTPAALQVSLSGPTNVSRGAAFNITMTVTNTGQAQAKNVVPGTPTVTPLGGAAAAVGTLPAAQNIDGGMSATFTIPFTENGSAPGTLTVAAGAAGQDANSGLTVTGAVAAASPVVVGQLAGALAVTGFTAPQNVSRGQGFSAVLVVTNTGGSTVNNVVPTTPVVNKTGTANATTSSSFAAVSLAPGASQTFTFDYTENGTGPGTLSFTAHATGTDSLTTNAVSAADVTSNVVTVQTPASLSITSLTIPAKLSRGQSFTATLVVHNGGQASAQNVQPSPNPPALTPTGGANAATTDQPPAVTIAGGADATFTWTYTEGGTGTGTLRLATAVTGTDANSGGALSTSATNSNTATVQTPAALSVTSFTVPSAVLRGGTFSASLVVTNTGEADASAVLPNPSPPTVTAAGGADASSATTLTAVTIAGGASHTFTWSFTESGTAAGTLALSTAVAGQDANSGAALSTPQATSNTLSVQTPGGLVITDFSFPTTLSRGQSFTLSMTVQNTGGSTVNNVAPSPLQPTVNKTGGADATTASAPAAQNLAAGASATFTWSYTESGTGAGTLSFTGSAQGTGSVSGSTITAGTVTTAISNVQTAPSLTVTSITGPANVSRGQSFTVQMVVSNSGQATANGVLPSPIRPTVQATGTAGATSSTSPAAQNIAGGGSATFTWTFTENGSGTGTLKFTDGAAGTDANSGAAVSAASAQSATAVNVQTPAALSITSFTIRNIIQRGSLFNTVVTVQNTGQAAANLVVPNPSPPTQTATGGANASTSTTVSSVTLNGGASTTFAWIYTETGSAPGTLKYTTSVAGVDANSGAAVTSSPFSTIVATVQEVADLEVTAFTLSSSTLSVGQSFTASITVHNRGGTTANNVLPSPDPPNVNGTGGATATTATTLTPFTLAAGASHVFTWTFTESGGPGTLQLAAGATGVDAISGGTVTAPLSGTPVATVQSPASLSVTSITIPGTLSRGQSFTALMTVTNTGQATANNVLPSPLRPTAVGAGGPNASSSSNPSAQTIAGGGSVNFSFTYTENGTGPGSLKLNGGATGTDANSGSTVTASAIDSNTATVQTAASLSITSFTVAPATIMRGAGFTLSMTVTNSGQATANGVLPSPNTPTLTVLTGTANATTSTTQTAQNIAGGGSATFNWTYTENGAGPGTLRFTAAAGGSDANSGSAVNAASANSGTLTVQTPPNLSVSTFTTSQTTLSQGQAFTATMTVLNTGGTAANGVLPSPNPPTVNVLSGTPNATTSTTLTAQTIAAGGSTTFTWTYTENGTAPGTFSLSAGAAGTNAVTGGAVSASSATTATVTVESPAALSISAFTIPDPTGLSFTATMQIQNTGQATANGVQPVLQAPIVSGVTLTQTSSPTPQSIAGGATGTFTWTYDVAGTGTLQLQAGATGTDVNSGATITFPTTLSNTASAPLRPPPEESRITVSPRVVEPGGTVTVTMTVKNTGKGVAQLAPPAALSLEGPAEVTLIDAPPVVKAKVAAGAERTFEWTYRAAHPGWVTFSGAPSGGAKVTSRHLTIPAAWCATASSLVASAGPAVSGRCNQALVMGGAPSAVGGAGRYRYEWTPGEGLADPLAANPSASPRVASTDYTLTVTDADGCQALASARAEVTDAPVATSSGGGQDLQLSCPAGGCVEAWAVEGGTSRYTATDANGCQAVVEAPLAAP